MPLLLDSNDPFNLSDYETITAKSLKEIYKYPPFWQLRQRAKLACVFNQSEAWRSYHSKNPTAKISKLDAIQAATFMMQAWRGDGCPSKATLTSNWRG